MKVFLIGYMACGKTTIGRKLNQHLKWKLCDTDKEIVSRNNQSIAEIFDTKGEEYFRKAERDTIESLIGDEANMIISTGGGAPTYSDNMEIMNRAGLTVFISRSAENTVKRLSKFGREKRPKLRGLDDVELLAYMQNGIAEREEFYSKAELVIDANICSDDDVVMQIVAHMER